MQMKLKQKQTQEIMLSIQNYDIIFFTDDFEPEETNSWLQEITAGLAS